MDKRFSGRLIETCRLLYIEDGYPKVVARAKELYKGDPVGMKMFLTDFNKYMEDRYVKGTRKSD